jgi:NAD-dependent deacetylase
MDDRTVLDAVAARVRAARRVTLLTGAGISAASGVPTFRGTAGLWRQVRGEDLATAAAFRRDPRLVWEWYEWRRQIIARCEPNAAHDVLATWSRRLPGCSVITQNVDGLHERAGTAGVVRLHGSIWRLSCWTACGAYPEGWDDTRVPLPEVPPSCAACGGLARPAVVWFGESLDPRDWNRAESATRCDIFFAIGTSAVVYPAASLAARARASGATVVEINPDATPGSAAADLVVRAAADEALPAIARLLES